MIEQARISSETRTLTDEEIVEAKEYIFIETIKDEKYKALQEFDSLDKVDVSFLDWFGIQTASAVCPNTTNPSFKQLSLDITGGTFWEYTFEGNNDMYSYTYYDNPSTCEQTYALYFIDEDHPIIDALYDDIRLVWFGRIHDIEMFSIQNNNQIEFDNVWSASEDYGCVFTLNVWNLCHGITTKTYIPPPSHIPIICLALWVLVFMRKTT